MPRDNIEFSENLIKTKIAQILFERMFIEMDSAIVIPFSIEATSIVMHQFQPGMNEHDKQDLAHVRNSPDYLLISRENKNAILVQVKYRKKIDPPGVKKMAEELYKRWPSAWLFIVTPEGFYFGKSEEIKNEGKIPPLPIVYLPQERQNEYLNLLKKYIVEDKVERSTTQSQEITAELNEGEAKKPTRKRKRKRKSKKEVTPTPAE